MKRHVPISFHWPPISCVIQVVKWKKTKLKHAFVIAIENTQAFFEISQTYYESEKLISAPHRNLFAYHNYY